MSGPTYWQDLRAVLRCTVPNQFDRDIWGEVWSAAGGLLWSLVVVAMRLLAQLTFPLSVWPITWLVRRDRRKMAARMKAANPDWDDK